MINKYCPQCGSEDIETHKEYTATGTRVKYYECHTCYAEWEAHLHKPKHRVRGTHEE